jgi:hypothetical protein
MQEIDNPQKICNHCEKPVERQEDCILCPVCISPHHYECWYENSGCSSEGCTYKIKVLENSIVEITSIKSILVNAEYLINQRKYQQAINECQRILNVEDNLDAKLLYNKAVRLENAKSKLIERANKEFENENYKESKILYEDSLKYADENESPVINSKIRIIEEKIPAITKKKKRKKIISGIILIILLISFGLFLYFYLFLEDYRMYNEIARTDSFTDTEIMQNQIVRYEKFIEKYPDSKFAANSFDKINILSLQTALILYQSNWKIALDYAQKVSVKEKKNELLKLIYDFALNEYNKNNSKASEFDKQKKYNEAKTEFEKSLFIINKFPDFKIFSEKQKILNNISLIEKKKKSVVELKNVEERISEIEKSLSSLAEKSNQEIVEIEGEIIDKINSPDYIIIKRINSGKVVAVKGLAVNLYRKNDYVNFDCIKSGTVIFKDKEIPEFTFSENISKQNLLFERESLTTELYSLRAKKNKLDSLINLKF